MPQTYSCPYFVWEGVLLKGFSVNCEGAKLKFGTKEERDDYVSAFCANCPGWELCSVAVHLNKKHSGDLIPT